MARSSSDGITMRYVLPVLRMTSCFHTMGPIGRIKAIAPSAAGEGRKQPHQKHFIADDCKSEFDKVSFLNEPTAAYHRKLFPFWLSSCLGVTALFLGHTLRGEGTGTSLFIGDMSP